MSDEVQSQDCSDRDRVHSDPHRSSLIAHRSVYLTFDDGPDPEWTPRILEVLAQEDMHGTFFVIGEHVRRTPMLARRIAQEGHAIGNHTFSHRHPWFMTPRVARAQVRDGAATLRDVIGQSTHLYRPPHGCQRACMNDEARRGGERVVMWDLSAIDWGPLGAAAKIEQRLAQVKQNDIVLMHDGRNRHNRPDQLLRVLPAFLRGLKTSGLNAATLAG